MLVEKVLLIKPLTLQRHFSTSTKFAHVESRFCGGKQRGKAAYCTSTNPCARRACSRSVAVGIRPSYLKGDFVSVYKQWQGECVGEGFVPCRFCTLMQFYLLARIIHHPKNRSEKGFLKPSEASKQPYPRLVTLPKAGCQIVLTLCQAV